MQLKPALMARLFDQSWWAHSQPGSRTLEDDFDVKSVSIMIGQLNATKKNAIGIQVDD